MRLETFIRKGLRLRAHSVIKVEEDEASQELVIRSSTSTGASTGGRTVVNDVDSAVAQFLESPRICGLVASG